MNNGWNIYNPREEFGRMGVGTRSKAWRFTTINNDYSVRPSHGCAIMLSWNNVPVRVVLADVPLKASGSDPHKRYHSPVCRQVPEQGATTGSDLPALGELRASAN